jgi:hypothetical protein
VPERLCHQDSEVADLSTCKPSRMLMEPRLKLSKLSSAPVVDATFYRSIVVLFGTW